MIQKGTTLVETEMVVIFAQSVFLSRTLSAFIIWCTSRVLVMYYYKNKIGIVEQFFCIIFAHVSLFVEGFVPIYKLAQG